MYPIQYISTILLSSLLISGCAGTGRYHGRQSLNYFPTESNLQNQSLSLPSNSDTYWNSSNDYYDRYQKEYEKQKKREKEIKEQDERYRQLSEISEMIRKTEELEKKQEEFERQSNLRKWNGPVWNDPVIDNFPLNPNPAPNLNFNQMPYELK